MKLKDVNPGEQILNESSGEPLTVFETPDADGIIVVDLATQVAHLEDPEMSVTLTEDDASSRDQSTLYTEVARRTGFDRQFVKCVILSCGYGLDDEEACLFCGSRMDLFLTAKVAVQHETKRFLSEFGMKFYGT